MGLDWYGIVMPDKVEIDDTDFAIIGEKMKIHQFIWNLNLSSNILKNC